MFTSPHESHCAATVRYDAMYANVIEREVGKVSPGCLLRWWISGRICEISLRHAFFTRVSERLYFSQRKAHQKCMKERGKNKIKRVYIIYPASRRFVTKTSQHAVLLLLPMEKKLLSSPALPVVVKNIKITSRRAALCNILHWLLRERVDEIINITGLRSDINKKMRGI